MMNGVAAGKVKPARWNGERSMKTEAGAGN